MNSLVVRILAPACMLFTVNFKTYLVFVLPPTLIASTVLHAMTEDLYTGTL